MLDVVPCHYSQLPSMLDNGVLPCYVMFLHVSPPGPDGKSSLGTAHDYLLSAARRARVVIAEINEQMPWTYGAHGLEEIHFDAVVHSSRPLPETPVAVVGQGRKSGVEGKSVARLVDLWCSRNINKKKYNHTMN